MTKTSPLYVGCHTCHAQVGQPCRFGLVNGEKYHSMRVARAKNGPHWIDTEHALAHGDACTDTTGITSGICTKCGQTIARLKAIPALLAFPDDKV